MKRICCLMALSILPFLCAPASAQEVSSDLVAETLDRAETASNPAQLLMGHWAANNGTTHYYFGQDEVIIINLLRRRDNSIVQHKQKLDYEVITTEGGWIELELQTPLDWAETRLLRLTDDRRALTELMQVMGHSFRNQWTYMSDRQQP